MIGTLAQNSQLEIYKRYLDNIVDPKHELCILANRINWSHFDKVFQRLYYENNGHPGIPTCRMVALHCIKYAFNESDESVVAKYREKPYWQYFCGGMEFKNEFSCDPATKINPGVTPSA